MTTRRKFGLGIAAMLAAQRAPAALVRSLVAGRHIAATGTRLPYDAEVAWLESTGTQWIDTGLYGDNNTVANIRACATAKGALYPLFGARFNYNSRGFAVYNGSDVGYYYTTSFDNVYYYSYAVSTAPADIGTWTDFQIGRIMQIGAWTKDYADLNPTAFTTPNTLLLFGWNQNGTIVRGKYKVSSCSISQNGVLVRDYYPVRFINANGIAEGAMYDRANPDGGPLGNGLYPSSAANAPFVGACIGPDRASQLGGGYKCLIVLSDPGPSWRPSAWRYAQSSYSVWRAAA